MAALQVSTSDSNNSHSKNESYVFISQFSAISTNANAFSILKMSGGGEQNTITYQPTNEQYGSEAGKSLLQSSESTIRFKVNKGEVDKAGEKEECLKSPEFKLNDVIWMVKVCRKEDHQTKYVSVELESVFKNETITWSCKAEAEVKLTAKKEGVEEKKGKIESTPFSRKNSVKGIDKFIKWEDFDKYLDQETATFEFNIKTESPNRSERLEQTTAKFMLRIKQINDKLSEYSNELTVRGIRWQVYAAKLGDYFAIFVKANENDIDTKAKWAVTTNFKLLSTPKDGKPKERQFTDEIFDWTRTDLGFTKFLEWSEFMKSENGYVRNNAALVEILLKVEAKAS